MTDNNSSLEPDRVGFEKTLALPLRCYCGIVFVELRGVVESHVRELVDRYGAVDAQKHLNHFHMVQRASALELQRKWAFELLDHFRHKASATCPGVILVGEVRDDGYDVEVTFWLPANERLPQ
jgi:hypothetical protein